MTSRVEVVKFNGLLRGQKKKPKSKAEKNRASKGS